MATSQLKLRVVFCNVDKPSQSPPLMLDVLGSMTVQQLQEKLYNLEPSRAQTSNHVRLFCQRDGTLPGVGSAAIPRLSFCSRPAETMTQLKLQPEASSGGLVLTIYWASNLMTFQEEASQERLLPLCDPEVEQRVKAAEEARTAAEKKRKEDARAKFWALPHGPWPSDLTATETRFYWSKENEYHMGESILLQLLPEEGEFRRHDHRWSDGGNHCKHHHALVKGVYRLVPVDGSTGYTIHMMPTHKWKSHRPPIKWEDAASFTAIPREQANPLSSAKISADGVELDGKRLVYHKG